MSETDVTIDAHVDARGLKCPLPVLRTAKVLRDLPAGAVVQVQATDPMAVIDIPHFCAEAGHDLLAQSDAADHQVYRIKKAS